MTKNNKNYNLHALMVEEQPLECCYTMRNNVGEIRANVILVSEAHQDTSLNCQLAFKILRQFKKRQVLYNDRNEKKEKCNGDL